MRQSRAETVDELIEHEFAVHQRIAVHLNLFGQVMQKLDLHSASALTAYAIEKGLVEK